MGRRFISIPNVKRLTGKEEKKPVQWIRDSKEEEKENASDIKKLLDLINSPSLTYEKQRTLIEFYRQALTKCINLHVRDCRLRENANYEKSNMKMLVDHTEMCDKFAHGCHICDLVVSVATEHCKHCNQPKCNVPFCGHYKFGRERIVQKASHKKSLLSALKTEETNKLHLHRPVSQLNEEDKNLRSEILTNALSLEAWLNSYDAKLSDAKQKNLLEKEEKWIGKSIELHIFDCKDGHPNYYGMSGMKILIDHLKNCRKKPLTCYVCDQVCGYTLSHFESCEKTECNVVFCGPLKTHEKEKLCQKKVLKQKQLLSSFDICPSYVPEKILNNSELPTHNKKEKTDEEVFVLKIIKNTFDVQEVINFYNSFSNDEKSNILLERHKSYIRSSVKLHILIYERDSLDCKRRTGMEMLIHHLKNCNKQPFDCDICNQVCKITLDHCERCPKLECSTPFCRRRKLYKKETALQKNLRQKQLLGKRKLLNRIGFQDTNDLIEESKFDGKLKQGLQISPIHKMLLLRRIGQRSYVLNNRKIAILEYY